MAVLAAATMAAAQDAGLEAIRATNLRADLTFLASEPLEGRASLARRSEVAIQFIAAEFAKAGLQPAAGGSYLQRVPLIEYRVEPQESAITLERAGAAKRFDYGSAGFLGSFPNDITVKSAVVFAGYGISAPEYGYDDYAGLDVRGKIALVMDHEPQENNPRSVFNGLGNTRHANVRGKTLNAQQHGAVALLVMNEPNRKHPSNQERLARIPGILDRMIRYPSQALAESEVKIPALTVSDALAAELLAASGRKPGDLQAQMDTTLKPAGLPLPDTVAEIRLVTAERRRGLSYNVVGLLEGGDPALRSETVIFSSHYDHDGIREGKAHPGADDNGSGTVGVMELARAFARSASRPKRSLLFISFAAEERGLLGSYYYVAHPLRPLATTRAVINFDMIGRNEASSSQTDGLMEITADTSNELNFTGTAYSPDYRAAIEQENAKIGLKLNYKWEKDAALNLFQRSDQFPFLLRDVPAVWFFTGFHPDYHQPTDTVEKINFAKMEKIVRLAYLVGRRFADADPARVPKFLPDPRGSE